MIRTVLTEGDHRLRATAAPAAITPELRRVAEDLIDSMQAAGGIGLAAPQIGIPLRVIAVDWGTALGEERPRVVVFVNPVITAQTRDAEPGEEGCLSVPGRQMTVCRSSAVEVRAQHVDGRPLHAVAEGLAARVLQHEIDHLEGVLITDRAEERR